MYEVIDKDRLAPDIVRLEVKAPEVAAKAKPGHFLIVRVNEKSERIPLTIADYDRDKGTITIIIQKVGYSSQEICYLEVGDAFLDLAAPLGNPMDTSGYNKVICVAGGLGAAPLYPKAKSLVKHQTEVTTILGAQKAEKLILEEEFALLSNDLYLATDDGSKGHHGFVTDILEGLLEEDTSYDLVIAIGPMPMMKAVADLTEDYNLKTIVSLNTLMVDGTGMCGGCRVTVDDKTKFACVDGPAFDGHLVDFEEQLRRQQFYNKQEQEMQEHSFGEGDCRVGQE